MDVGRHCDQLRLLFPGGALGQEKTDGRDVDDAENFGVCLDDLHGVWADREMRERQQGDKREIIEK